MAADGGAGGAAARAAAAMSRPSVLPQRTFAMGPSLLSRGGCAVVARNSPAGEPTFPAPKRESSGNASPLPDPYRTPNETGAAHLLRARVFSPVSFRGC